MTRGKPQSKRQLTDGRNRTIVFRQSSNEEA